MKTQKTKNEILLDLLERKDWIIEDKIDCLREYQEWVINAPFKVITLITISMILEKVIGFLPKEKWWGDLIYKAVIIFFPWIIFFYLVRILATFSYSRSKIPHLNNQIYRTELKIREILAKLEEKKEE